MQPTERARVWLSWSSGKDSAHVLHVLRSDPRFDVCGLLTSVNAVHGRVAMHGVRASLLARQAEAVGLPLHSIDLPYPCSNDEYERRHAAALATARARGVTGVAFGDLFLADVRHYREAQLTALGFDAHFPLWGRDTRELAREMIGSGIRARIACLDPRHCPRELAAAEYDGELIARLPVGVDPCGENGEFHTFAWDGPEFAFPIPLTAGEVVERDGFVFADLVEEERT